MDPRQSLSRTGSSNIQQSPYTNPTMSAYAGNMPPQSYAAPHLPPINQYPQQSHLPPTSQNFMAQGAYRDNIPRYSQNPPPGGTPDNRYAPQIQQQQPMSNMSQPSMLPQPPNQAPQSQPYTSQPGARPPTYPQPLAPAPPRSNVNDPYGAYSQQGRDQPWTGAEQMPGMTTDHGRDPTRTHVVGSQGRRGILPSAPGRPPVMQNGSLNGSPKGNPIPQKDADGKFPCPNCTKTYLHAKHLKRHMLRHTGDRPYMCVLCTDTFSRSDILKRHFQKCSVRRGNPTGASHLSNPAAHLKKSQAAAQKAAAAAAAANASQSQNNSHTNTPSSSAAVQPSPYATSMPSSMPATTASLPAMSSMPYANGQNDVKPPAGQTMQGGQEQSNHASWNMNNSRSAQLMYNSNTASPAQGGHQVENDWNQFLPQAGNENYMGNMYGYEQAHPDVKHETHESGSNGYYMPSTSLGADGTLGPPLWHFSSVHESPLHSKVEQLVDFCFPPGIQESLQEQQSNDTLRSCLTVDNVKHFLEQYQNYQGHFPWLHLPTFDIFNAYDGLVLMILCSGAVYSDRISQTQVRSLLLRAKASIDRTSRLLLYYNSEATITPTETDLQELQALFLAQNILTWHGGPEERNQARIESRRLLRYVRQCQLLTLDNPGQPAYSYLHNLRPGQPMDPAQWNWELWLLQEKRLRLAFLALLSDAAWTLFFNCPPEFQSSEIRLPFPCDDAAWEAPDASYCASALGLHGPHYQTQFNISGSLKSRQISFDYAYRVLQDESMSGLQPRDTNVYGKFILVHVLHMDIWRLQKQRSMIRSNSSPYSGTGAVNVQTQQRAISLALTRWKQCWDTDMQLQYPPMPEGQGPRRIGFCRDGIHFYWLAKALIHPTRARDWQLPADTRFRQLMLGLKKAREWSLSDGAQRGEEPGSVADIDPTYEIEDLELDMRKLFRPLIEVQK